jgi:hypothetical protein
MDYPYRACERYGKANSGLHVRVKCRMPELTSIATRIQKNMQYRRNDFDIPSTPTVRRQPFPFNTKA